MNESTEEIVRRMQEFAARAETLRGALQQVIVGQHAVVEGVLTAVLAGGHVLLEGVPGLGKTLLVRTLAQATGLEFSRVQFTPDLQPKDILGSIQLVRDADGQERRTFERGPLFAHLVLADEINRATPRTQSALLEAMAEQSVTVGRETHRLPSPFLVLATQNPLEQDGTYPLPEAQLDRFLFKLVVPWPSLQELEAIMRRTLAPTPVTVSAVMGPADLLQLRATAAQVEVSESLLRWAMKVLSATHPGDARATPLVKRFVREGASPRGGQAMLQAARVRALLRGEPMVSQADIAASVLPALRHRIILNFEGEAEGVDRDRLLEEVVAATARA
jgi:MoxR-like ATPase